MTPTESERSKRCGQIVAEAWADPAFKQRLLADPASVLRERGIDLPTSLQVRMVEDSDQVAHLILPARPDEARLSSAQLDRVVGGAAGNGGGTGKWPKQA